VNNPIAGLQRKDEIDYAGISCRASQGELCIVVTPLFTMKIHQNSGNFVRQHRSCTSRICKIFSFFYMLLAARRGLSFVVCDTMQFGRDIGTFWRYVCSTCSSALKSEITIVTMVETSNFRAVFHYCKAITLFWNAAACSFGRMYFFHNQVIRVSPFCFTARYLLHYSERNYSSLYVL